MKKQLKKYKFALLMILIWGIMILLLPTQGQNVTEMNLRNIGEMLKVIPPIFILLGLLDVWVPKEQMIKYMGQDAGAKGILLAFALGSATAGPLYASFPIANALLKKEASFFNVLIFIGAASTTKIPLLLFEANAMGWKFTITRLLINIVGIIAIAMLSNKFLHQKDQEQIKTLSLSIK